MMTPSALLSTQNYVESPFIILKIGNYTFGHCEKSYKNKLQTRFNVTYPNYMESIDIVKVNGAVNTYTVTMNYVITPGDDPNRLEKVFGSISKTRTIKLSYGDWNAPAFIYKEEEAIITKLTASVDVKSSSIKYTIHCTSNSLALKSGTFSFNARRAKPSDVLAALMQNKLYGLTDIFPGMLNKDPSLFIARDDKEVYIEGRSAITLQDYVSYLVTCMTYQGEDSATGLKKNCYFWTVYDDTSGEYGGSYFRVQRVSADTPVSDYNTYEVDVGYPSAQCVVDFTVNNDDSWALLYNYAKNVHLPEYSYTINNDGQLIQNTSSVATTSASTYTTTEATKNWWSLVTQFPITATLKMKGLLRPAMLMSYVKVNTYFYGRKHTSSGLYVIAKQQDSISSSGYRTTLTLIRVGADESYV